MHKQFILCALTAGLLLTSSACAPAPELIVDQTTLSTTEHTAPHTQATEPTTAPTAVEPTPTDPPEPELPSLYTLLSVATQPVGNTMYVWGGGWNEADTGAGVEAVTLGLSPQWAAFAAQQDETYDYNTTRYQIHDGLDCSGYVGWVVYNTLETENGGEGYVCSSTKMAQSLSDRGFGSFIPAGDMTQWLPGDIMSQKGHCWIVVGMCDDGSVLLLHASPPGVRFCGTLLPDGSTSQAVALAQQVMQTQFPQWYAKYPDCSCSYSYLTSSSAMRWNRQTLSDPEGLSHMRAEDIVSSLFPIQ